MANQPVAEMALFEIEDEIAWMEGTFRDYERLQQGISSKEAVRYRNLKAEQDRRTHQ